MFSPAGGIRIMNGLSKKHLDIVIVGGSLAGLFAGTSLRRLGHNVSILERSRLSIGTIKVLELSLETKQEPSWTGMIAPNENMPSLPDKDYTLIGTEE
jgi:thioredoxin reductase